MFELIVLGVVLAGVTAIARWPSAEAPHREPHPIGARTLDTPDRLAPV